MKNPFVHLELSADDRSAAKKFYKGLFDWKMQDMPGMPWTRIDGLAARGVGGGGIGDKNMAGQPTAWTAYILVTDVKKTVAKAAKLGATVLVPFMDIGMGAIGVFTDPQGATLGVWEQGKKAPAKKAGKKAAPKKAGKKAAPKKAGKKAAPKKAGKKAAPKKKASKK